jgi:hypothetical protein
MSELITLKTLTDAMVQNERDGRAGVSDESYRNLCRVALSYGEPTSKYPICLKCCWRKGGVDSWDGKACKCGLRSNEYHTCLTCSGLGTVPYDLGSIACWPCDGSGLIDPASAILARQRICDEINARTSNGTGVSTPEESEARVAALWASVGPDLELLAEQACDEFYGQIGTFQDFRSESDRIRWRTFAKYLWESGARPARQRGPK